MELFEARRPATLESISWIRKALRRQLAQLRIGADISDEVVLALVELATNTVQHARPPAREIAVRVRLEGIVLTLDLEDDGGPFLGFAAAWEAASLTRMAPDAESGRGLPLARHFLDQARYQPGPPNRFVLRRQLARRRPQVLVVEDEEVLLETYLGLLEPHYRVIAARDLRSALLLTRETKVDLILTDFHLGAEPGTALVAALEEDRDRPPIPIVMITADSSVRTRALELGIDTFLTKPVTPEALLETIQLALTRALRQRVRLFRYFGTTLGQLVQPNLPQALGPFALALLHETADIGGGDLVVHLPRPGRERIVMVDVMGHGIDAKAGAIAHAAMVRALDLDPSLSPGQFLARWSDLIFGEPAFDAAIATALVVDLLADGTIEIASAGHPHPMILSATSARAVACEGPLLGFADRPRYAETRLTLAPGERLLLATDGLDPAELASGGTCPDWLVGEVQSRAALPLPAAAGRTAARISARLGPDPQDDWMLILLERSDPAGTGIAPAPAARIPAEPHREAAPQTLDPAGAADHRATPLPAGPAPEPVPPQGAVDLPAVADADGLELSGVAALRNAVSPAAFQGLAERFMENAARRFETWAALVEAGDGAALRREAHALAGLLGQFGLAGAADLARQVEHAPDDAAQLGPARALSLQGPRQLALLKSWLEREP
ncbi:SpoIIE family protein phosphatase [Roseixanthobacter glucoisosaccharinicivorans]|uniref:SpoIIE family protein phosphatase n=1 Tax=Roseixanthobacter glucoisosaccharinicivorans TaxID=3119923 RepID=UPI00372B5D3C